MQILNVEADAITDFESELFKILFGVHRATLYSSTERICAFESLQPFNDKF